MIIQMPKKQLMGKGHLWFYRDSGFKSTVTKLKLRSHWDHVAIGINDNVYMVTVSRGVQKISIGEFKEKYPTTNFTFVPLPDGDQALEYANSQVGKPFDLGVFQVFNKHRDWTNNTVWSDAELVAAILISGGVNLPVKHKGRLTPKQLWEALPIITFNHSTLQR